MNWTWSTYEFVQNVASPLQRDSVSRTEPSIIAQRIAYIRICRMKSMKISTMTDGVIRIGLRGLTDNEGMIALCDYLPSFQAQGDI